MERSKIPLHKWAIAIYMVSTYLKNVSSVKLHRDLGITQKSAWFMLLEQKSDLVAGMTGKRLMYAELIED